MRRVLPLAVGVGLVAALVVVTGVMAANDTTYAGCLDDKGNVTNVAEGDQPLEDCGKKGVVVTWNAEGPMGPEGPRGPQGVPGVDGKDGADGELGPQGPPGADGTDGQDGADGEPCTVADDREGTITLTCPDGSSASWDGTTTTSSTTTTTTEAPGGSLSAAIPVGNIPWNDLATLTLAWTGDADWDLHAVLWNPLGEHVWYGDPTYENEFLFVEHYTGDVVPGCGSNGATLHTERIEITKTLGTATPNPTVYFWADLKDGCNGSPNANITISADAGLNQSVSITQDGAEGSGVGPFLTSPYEVDFNWVSVD